MELLRDFFTEPVRYGPYVAPWRQLKPKVRRWAVGICALIALLCSFYLTRAIAPRLASVDRSAETRALLFSPDSIHEIFEEMAPHVYAAQYGIDPILASAIYATSLDEGIDPDLAFRIAWVESRFQPDALSRKGAVGIMQVMPLTAGDLHPGITDIELRQVDLNIRLGLRYYRMLYEQCGNLRCALLSYNRGPNRVRRLLEHGLDPANGYASQVLSSDAGRVLARYPLD